MTTIYGWDLSHYDAPTAHGAIAQGFRFMTHKLGGDATDAEADDWWADMRGHRSEILLGGYWVLYPGAPAARADAFLARLDVACPGWDDGPFILQVDCEKWRNDSGTVPPRADIKAFCDRLVARKPKYRPIVYAPEWVYGESLKGLGYPLWASSYVPGAGYASTLYPGDSSSRWHAYSGQTPAILQFTSSATIAGQTTCDANAYRGNLPALTALVSPGWAAPTPPKETTVPLTDPQQVWDCDTIPNPSFRTDSPRHTPPGTNENTQADFALGAMWEMLGAMQDQLNAQGASLAAIKSVVDRMDLDPADAGDDNPIVAATRYAIANPSA